MITLTNAVAGDVLSVLGLLPAGIVANLVGNVLTLSGSATLASYETAIEQVRFANSGDNPGNTARVINVVVNDGTGNSNTAVATISVTPLNDAPTLDLDANNSSGAAGNNFTTSYTENGPGVAVADTDISIVDPDNTNIASATITLTNAVALDVMSVFGVLPAGISSSIVAGVGTITVTLTGSATLASYQTAIQQVRYSSTSENPSTTPRTITVVVNDGTANSNTATTTVNVAAVNDAPVGVADARTAVEGTTTVLASVRTNDTDDVTAPASLTVVQFSTDGTTPVFVNGSSSVTTTLGGTVVMNTDGTFTYTAPPHQDHLPPPASNIDTFVYRVSDGSLTATAWTTVSITITDTGPTAVADADSVVRGTTITGNVITGAGGATADIAASDPLSVLTTVSFVSGATLISTTGTLATSQVFTTSTGVLTISQDGAYSYQSTAAAPVAVRTVAANRTAAQWETDLGGTALQVKALDGTTPWVGALPTSGLNTAAGTAGVVTTVTALGIGVETGGGTGNTDAFRIQPDDYLILNLDTPSRNTTLTFDALGAGEDAVWYAFNAAGGLVSQGLFSATTTGQIQTNTAFQYIVLSAGAGDAYSLNGIQAFPPINPVVFNYTVSDDDGSLSATTLTVDTSLGVAALPDTGTVYEAGVATGSSPGGVATPAVATGNLLSNDGINGTTTITGVTGATFAGGVYTLTDAVGTLQVWSVAGGGHVAGDYVYTLTGRTTEGSNDVLSFTYTITDTAPAPDTTSSATLSINVVDDAPLATNSSTQIAQADAAAYEIVLMLDVSGSMTASGLGEVRLVDDNGNAVESNRLALAKAAMIALVEEYFAQGSQVAVKLGSFSTTATILNGGVAYTSKDTLIAAINAFTAGGGTEYDNALDAMRGAFTSAFPAAPPSSTISRVAYFLSDGVPSTTDVTLDTAIAAYLGEADDTDGTGFRSFAVGLGNGIPNTSYLDRVHTVDSNQDGLEDAAIIVPDLNRLEETLLATVPTAYSGSVGGTGGASNVTFGGDGGYIGYLELMLDSADVGTAVDTLVRFLFNGTNSISIDPSTPAPWISGFPLASSVLTLDSAQGFTRGNLIFDFSTGAYTYYTGVLAVEGETFDLGFQVVDADGDTAVASQTLQVIDGAPIARSDYDTLSAKQSVFSGNVINGIGTDGGVTEIVGDFAAASVSKDSIIDGADVVSITFRGQVFDLTTVRAMAANPGAAGGFYSVDAAGRLTWLPVAPVANKVVAPAPGVDDGVEQADFNAQNIVVTAYDDADAGTNTTPPHPFVTAGSAVSGLSATAIGGTLTGAVRYRGANAGNNNDGVGVEQSGSSNNADRIEESEHLLLNLNASSRATQVTLTDLGNGEVMQWHAYDAAGAWVASGIYTGALSGGLVVAQTITIETETAFQYLAFTAGTGDNFRINGVNVTRATEGLIFDRDGYYQFTPPAAQSAAPPAAAATTLALTAAPGAGTGVTIEGYTRLGNLTGAPDSTVNYNANGAGVAGGGGGNDLDDLETLVITFARLQHPSGVQNVVIDVTDAASNLGGTDALTYSVYDISGNLLGQISTPNETPFQVPAEFSNIGRIEIEANNGADARIGSISYRSITGSAGGGTAYAPEVISYTLRDDDLTPDLSSANLTLQTVSDQQAGGTGNDTLTGGVLNDYIGGGAGNDTLSGGAGYDLVRGDDGNDTLNGGNEADRLFGGAGTDVVNGDDGNDQLRGDEGNDTLNGGNGTDVLYGDADNDTLDGGAGADTLYGGTGNDTLFGGAADGISDVFIWELGDRGNKGFPAVDTITSFNNANGGAGGDILDLRDILVGESNGGGTGGNLDDFIHFSVSGGNTRVHISSVGEFSASYSSTREVQTIVLQGVDLVGANTDLQIIQDLLTRGKLLTD
ncbi:beta strand repeat-containing protein [Caenimonas sedimenti]|uniref:beta strand repeat-containing protein n=1 Tax=Caenimonas sedimenti TaxID=2596921 RepID=UPI001C95382D|nr:type I secretion C-terminal target domain-containing protein [Caenimonas sedimenti]